VVAGPHVATAYLDDPASDRRHKIEEGGQVWHRTGDAAWLDAAGRLWLMGRVAQRIVRAGVTHWPLPTELRALALPGVRHAAYFGAPDPELGQRAILCVESRSAPEIADARAALDPAPVDALFALEEIPRDRRHHSKTDLEALRAKIGI
jgi:acyl-CoA synthetase (AMP-forming)/AMP-acid ligase II